MEEQAGTAKHERADVVDGSIGQTTEAPDEAFLPIELETLCTGTEKRFSLYLKTQSGKYVLYLSKEHPFLESHRLNLLKHGTEHLYIPVEDRTGYLSYVEIHLDSILKRESVSVETKARIIQTSVSRALEEVFEQPRAEFIQRSKNMIRSTVNLVLSDQTTTQSLLSLTLHDHSTYNHSVNVGIYGVAFARELLYGGSRHNLHELAAGFFLHDLGKSRVDPGILNKKGKLSEEEWQEIRMHPLWSYDILESTNHLTEEARIIALQHHERHNGKGYPHGRRGDEIHLYAKICCIADVFDALTSDRPYRKRCSTFEALDIMKSEMMSEFDPNFFSRFVILFKEQVSPVSVAS